MHARRGGRVSPLKEADGLLASPAKLGDEATSVGCHLHPPVDVVRYGNHAMQARKQKHVCATARATACGRLEEVYLM